jgi:cytochrome o ubiquinol oxidase subunit 2
MKPKMRVIGAFVATVVVGFLFYKYATNHNFAVLDPKGLLAFQERRLLFITLMLSLLVVIPVFSLTIYIAWKYREGNTKSKYAPHWDHDARLEFAWWAVPIVIITILATITWQYTHRLDPSKPISTTNQAVNIQVVALQWRWLFIYPDEKVASINYMPIPVNRPINLQITSDAPMNSIWIPQLSGQIYAM